MWSKNDIKMYGFHDINMSFCSTKFNNTFKLRIYRNAGYWLYKISYHNRHYNDVIMGAIASQITRLTIVYSIVYSDADQRKHQSSASLAFVRGIHQGPVNSPHKWPVTRKMFPFHDFITVIVPQQMDAAFLTEYSQVRCAFLLWLNHQFLWNNVKLLLTFLKVTLLAPRKFCISI